MYRWPRRDQPAAAVEGLFDFPMGRSAGARLRLAPLTPSRPSRRIGAPTGAPPVRAGALAGASPPGRTAGGLGSRSERPQCLRCTVPASCREGERGVLPGVADG